MSDQYIIGKNVTISPITLAQIDEALSFQSNIIAKMTNPEWFTPLTKEEFLTPIQGRDNVYFLKYQNETIGLAVATCDIPELLQEYKLPNSDALLIDSIMVEENYRGSHLQAQVLSFLENRAKELGIKNLVAVVHPNNQYSLNNFLKNNYSLLHDVFIHGGVRHVLYKTLP